MTASELTSEEIRTRLAELDELEAEHSARDLDSELAGVLAEGGDVDALEESHALAERVSRRHRIARQALLAALPDAMAREAAVVVEQAEQQREELRDPAIKARDKIVKSMNGLVAAVDQWKKVREQIVEIDHKARLAANAAGIEPPRIPVFGSPELREQYFRLLATQEALAFEVDRAGMAPEPD